MPIKWWTGAVQRNILPQQTIVSSMKAVQKRSVGNNNTKRSYFRVMRTRLLRVSLALEEQRPTAKEDLLKQAGYFTHNQHRMQYLEMRSEGWLIGSDVVESGGKRFQDRFTCSGMDWSRIGVERFLPFRGAIMSRRFDERWQAAQNLPVSRGATSSGCSPRWCVEPLSKLIQE